MAEPFGMRSRDKERFEQAEPRLRWPRETDEEREAESKGLKEFRGTGEEER